MVGPFPNSCSPAQQGPRSNRRGLLAVNISHCNPLVHSLTVFILPPLLSLPHTFATPISLGLLPSSLISPPHVLLTPHSPPHPTSSSLLTHLPTPMSSSLLTHLPAPPPISTHSLPPQMSLAPVSMATCWQECSMEWSTLTRRYSTSSQLTGSNLSLPWQPLITMAISHYLITTTTSLP